MPYRYKKKTYKKKRAVKTYKRRGNRTILSRQLRLRTQVYTSIRTKAYEVLHTHFTSLGTYVLSPFITGLAYGSPPAGTFPVVVRDFANFQETFARYRIVACSARIQTTNQVSTDDDNISMMVIPRIAATEPSTWDEGINRRQKRGPMSLGPAGSATGRSVAMKPVVADYSWRYESTSTTQAYKYTKPPWFSNGVPQNTIKHYLPHIIFQTIQEVKPATTWKMFINFTITTQYSMEY